MRSLAASFLVPLLFVACGESTDAAVGNGAVREAPPEFPPLPPDVEVTLATKLVPGIPGSPGHLIKSSRNPNGDSELAYLMRLFVDDLREARTKVEAGEPLPRLYDRHRRMRAAWPTDASMRNAEFDGMAQGYLTTVRTFEGDPTPANYNAIIASCVACHSATCGGVIEFIESLRWQ